MTMRYGKAFESLADMSARFVQFRDVLLAMEGKANHEGLGSGNLALRVNRAKG